MTVQDVERTRTEALFMIAPNVDSAWNRFQLSMTRPDAFARNNPEVPYVGPFSTKDIASSRLAMLNISSPRAGYSRWTVFEVRMLIQPTERTIG